MQNYKSFFKASSNHQWHKLHYSQTTKTPHEITNTLGQSWQPLPGVITTSSTSQQHMTKNQSYSTHSPQPPKCQRYSHIYPADFPWPYFKITSSLRRTRIAACGYQQCWSSCSWQKDLRVESFHRGSTLGCVKENWVMSLWNSVAL